MVPCHHMAAVAISGLIFLGYLLLCNLTLSQQREVLGDTETKRHSIMARIY